MSEPEQDGSKGGEDVVNVLTDIMAPVDDDFDEEVKTTTPAKKVVKKVAKTTKSTAQTKTVKKSASLATAKATKQTTSTPAASEESTPKTETTSEQPPKTKQPTTASSTAASTTPAKATSTGTTPANKTKKVVKKTPVAAKSGAATKQATAKPTAGKTASAAKKKPVKVVKKTTPASVKAKAAASAKESAGDSGAKAKADPVESAKVETETVLAETEETKAPEDSETPMEVTEDDHIKDVDNSAEISTEAIPDVEISKEGADGQDEEQEEEEENEEEAIEEEDESNVVEGEANGDGDMEPPDFSDTFDVRSEASSTSSGSQIDDADSDHDNRQQSRRDRKRQFSPIVYEGQDISDSDDENGKKAKLSSSVNEVKGGDQTAKMKYLFRDARYFLIKSNNHENISLAKAKGSGKARSGHQACLHKPQGLGSSSKWEGRVCVSQGAPFQRPAKKKRSNSYSAAIMHPSKRKHFVVSAAATSEMSPDCRTAFALSRESNHTANEEVPVQNHLQRNSSSNEGGPSVHLQAKKAGWSPKSCKTVQGHLSDKHERIPHRYIYRRQKARFHDSNKDPCFSDKGHPDISYNSIDLNGHDFDDLSFEFDDEEEEEEEEEEDDAFYPSQYQSQREYRWRKRERFSDNRSNFGSFGGHDIPTSFDHPTENTMRSDTADLERLLQDASAKLHDQSSLYLRIQQLEGCLGNVITVLHKLVKMSSSTLQKPTPRPRRKRMQQFGGPSGMDRDSFRRWKSNQGDLNERRIEGESELDEGLMERQGHLDGTSDGQQTLDNCDTRSDRCQSPEQPDNDENPEERLSASDFQPDSRCPDSGADNCGDLGDLDVISSHGHTSVQNNRVENDAEQNSDTASPPNNSEQEQELRHDDQASCNVANGEEGDPSPLKTSPDSCELGTAEKENSESIVQGTRKFDGSNVVHEEANESSAMDKNSSPVTFPGEERDFQADLDGPVIIRIKSEFSCDDGMDTWPDSSQPSTSYNHPGVALHDPNLVVLSDDSCVNDNPVAVHSSKVMDTAQSLLNQQAGNHLGYEHDADIQSLQEILATSAGSDDEDVKFLYENVPLGDQKRGLKTKASQDLFHADQSEDVRGKTELICVEDSDSRWHAQNSDRRTATQSVRSVPVRLRLNRTDASSRRVQKNIPQVLSQNGNAQYMGMPCQSQHYNTNLPGPHQGHAQKLQQSGSSQRFHSQSQTINSQSTVGRRNAAMRSASRIHTACRLPVAPPNPRNNSATNFGNANQRRDIYIDRNNVQSVAQNNGSNIVQFGHHYRGSPQERSHSLNHSPYTQPNMAHPYQAGNESSSYGGREERVGSVQADGIITDVLAERDWINACSEVDGATSLTRALAQALFGDSILIKSTLRSSGKYKDYELLDPNLVKKIEDTVMKIFCHGKNEKYQKHVWSLCKQSMGQRMKYLRNRYSLS
ncbi:uncharacterized protein LOC129271916 isoform X2 [Lytechinus pictus]|uniref:uncharacterized protein LOC129271916 isoform X2 n=1 Tax=Lytechinus pictus TaxID=7653 RepID=UPI0030B9C95B